MLSVYFGGIRGLCDWRGWGMNSQRLNMKTHTLSACISLTSRRPEPTCASRLTIPTQAQSNGNTIHYLSNPLSHTSHPGEEPCTINHRESGLYPSTPQGSTPPHLRGILPSLGPAPAHIPPAAAQAGPFIYTHMCMCTHTHTPFYEHTGMK